MKNFTGQDTWQEPIADICSKIKVKKYEHMSKTPMH